MTVIKRLPRWLSQVVPGLVLCLACLPLSAANLGELTLKSGLGERLNASIVIESASAKELDTLQASFAEPQFARQKGVVLPEILRDLRLQIDKTNGQPVVILSSISAVKEPFLNLIIQLSWAEGTYLREYTILIDPIIDEGGNYMTFGGVETRETETPDDINLDKYQYDNLGNISPLPELEAALPGTPDSNATSSQPNRITVQQGDSLMAIARTIAPDFVTVEQVTTALFRNNPQAFFGSIDQLKAGAVLKVPTVADMQLQSYSAARASLQAQREHSITKIVAQETDVVLTQPIQEPVEQLPLAQQDPVENTRPPETGNHVEMLDQPIQDVRAVVSELQTSLGELRVTLDLKSAQLRAVSTRIDQLQRDNAVAIQQPVVTNKSVHAIADTKPEIKESAVADSDLPVSSESSTTEDEDFPAPFGSDGQIGTTIDQDTDGPTNNSSSSVIQTEPPTTDNQSAQELSEGSLSDSSGAEVAVDVGEPVSPDTSMSSIDNTNQTVGYKNEDGDQSLFYRLVSLILVALVVAGLYLIFSRLLKPRYNQRSANELTDTMPDALATDRYSFENSIDSHFGDSSDRAQPVTDAAPDNSSRQEELLENTSAHTTRAESGDTSQEVTAEEPIEAWFDAQLSHNERKEQDLLMAIEAYPRRQEIRLELLKLYADRKATAKFEALAHDIYQMNGNQSAEWHQVIELGLALDANLQFYPTQQADSTGDFDIPTSRVVTSVPAGTSVDTINAAQDITSKVSVDLGPVESPPDLTLSPSSNPGSKAHTERATDTQAPTSNPDHSDANSAAAGKQPHSANFGNEDLDIVLDMTLLDPPPLTEDQRESKEIGNERETESLEASHPSTEPAEIPTNSPTQNVKTQSASSKPLQSHSIASSISDWKQIEIKLDLAILQHKMGNHDEARRLFHEIIDTGDSLQQEVARAMLSKLV